MSKAYRLLARKPEKEWAREKKTCRWNSSTEKRCKVLGSEKMDRIYLVQYRIQRKAVQRGTQKLNSQFHKWQGISEQLNDH